MIQQYSDELVLHSIFIGNCCIDSHNIVIANLIILTGAQVTF